MRIFIIYSVFVASRKHWLIEENATLPTEIDNGFIHRHGPFQSSLNEGKNKRTKKPGILRGIGHMFRFGKHRKDGIAPVADTTLADESIVMHKHANKENKHSGTVAGLSNGTAPTVNRKPPNYQPPPPVGIGIPVASNGIHHNDVFNHRYSHYANHDELQQQIRYE